MNRVEQEVAYWEDQALGDIDRAVCDAGLEGYCFKKLRLPSKGDVLEIGCGVGRLLLMCPVVKGVTYYGVDCSARMVGEALRRCKKRRDIRLGLNDGRSFAEKWRETFEYVYSIAVFQHIDDEGVFDYLEEINRVLDDKGKFTLQFVVGEEKTAFSWQRGIGELGYLFLKAGLRIDEMEADDIMPNWVFVHGGVL